MNELTEEIKSSTASYLTFKLGGEQFAVNASNVIEILEFSKISKVPRSPEFLIGVINLRGTVLPVIDTGIKFEMEKSEITEDTCIVVMNVEIDGDQITMGALVDAVDAVLDISLNEIKESPSIGSQYNPDFIEGVVKINEDFMMILNIGKVFSTEEARVMNNAKSDETKL